MARRSPRTTQHVDQDGVRTITRSGVRTSVWLLVAAMTLVGVAVLLVIRPAIQQATTPPAEPRAADLSANVRGPAATALPLKAAPQGAPVIAAAPHRPDVGSSPEGQLRAVPPREAASNSGPTGTNPNGAGETGSEPTGIAVFPPPGTKPIKRGIIVPEGFDLPPGYVRHYQTTDDGHQLPPILMFHPDYRPVDEQGEPIPLPDDRVVPPEMAPAGIPVQTLDVPEEGAMDGVTTGGGRKRLDP